MDTSIQIKPIGKVEASNNSSIIKIDEEYRDALIGLEDFSHANIIWWCHKLADPEFRQIYTAEKPYKTAPDILGIFSTRSPVRPNPIAITTVEIISIDKESGIIKVANLDADDETPVLDIKSYYPSEERIKNVKLPDWCSHWPMWYEDSANFDWEKEFNFPIY